MGLSHRIAAARAAAPAQAAPDVLAPSMPVRLPGGKIVTLVPGAPPPPAAAPVARPAPFGSAGARVLGGGGRRVPPPPSRIPGGIPAASETPMPAVPAAPVLPTPTATVARGAGEGRPAPKVVVVPTNCFADTWNGKPARPLEIGLRLIGDADLDTARAYASRLARQRHPDPGDVDGRTEAYNEVLMQWVVAEATCKPHDVSARFFQTHQDTVPIAFTEDGLKYMFHELLALKIEQSPLIPEAGINQIATLVRLLSIPGVANTIVTRAEPRLRRHIGWILSEVKKVLGAEGFDDGAVEGDDEIELPVGPVT